MRSLVHHRLYPWIVWGCAGLFYFYEMILRASPSVMAGDLMRDFGVTSTSLGVLSSFYYYSYVALQIPCGLIVDRMGVRFVLTFSSLLCVIGSLCFAHSHSLGMAEMGRFLIGAGSACAFISCLKLSSEWFPLSQFALIAGLTNMMGTIGGMVSGPPFAFLVNQFGWRQATLIAAYVGIGIACLCWGIIREKPSASLSSTSFAPSFSLYSDLMRVVRHPQAWIYAIFGGLMYVPIAAFCELWCVPFLIKKYGIPNESAAFANVMIYLGVAFGSPLVVKLATPLHKRQTIMGLSALLTTLLFIGVIYLPFLPFSGMLALLFLAGLSSSGQILSFPSVKELFSNGMSGTATGFTNAVVMMSGFIFQPLLGALLDWTWKGTLDGEGIRSYALTSYETAILAVPACLGLSWVLMYLSRRVPLKERI